MSKRYRVTNTTGATGNAAYLEYNGKWIINGRHIFVDEIDEVLEDWQNKGHIRVHDMEKGEFVGGSAIVQAAPMTAGARLNEVASVDMTEDDEFAFDPEEAVEAGLPVYEGRGQHLPDTRQESGARVSNGFSERSTHNDDAMSPIPGQRARDVDDSARFTIKAPNSHAVGGIIGKN